MITAGLLPAWETEEPRFENLEHGRRETLEIECGILPKSVILLEDRGALRTRRYAYTYKAPWPTPPQGIRITRPPRLAPVVPSR